MRVFTTFALILFVLTAGGQSPVMPFNSSWQFRNLKEEKWYPAEVPGTIHTDLLSNKLIPDPFYRDNESKVQWIEKEDWVYRTVFVPGEELLKQGKLKLVFDGLDTYATIFLNGEKILSTNNMFRQWKVEVRQRLKKGNNELRIIFSSASRHDDSLAKIYPVRLAGENNRMYSRKAQYQYGWDWGPRLVTCGIWKPVHWELWDEQLLAPKSHGGWNIKLVQKPDSAGTSFYFTKDGVPLYIKGANWIPCESFLPRAKKLDLYTKLIREAKEANINMLRVWGGGVYEDDMFYDLCDEYGIMVWQDFMFAGAMYPIDRDFLDNVEQEVRYQVQRLKEHPCIVLWCGNNEIDEAWHNWGWQEQFGYSRNDSTRLWKGYERLFHELIPRILKELDPSRPYWPSSPSLGWGRSEAYKKGDVHYWGVWWGKEPVEEYAAHIGRFNSEYGMQGFPSIQSIREFTTPGDLDTASLVMKVHQKHPFGYQNIRLYIENKYRAPTNFQDLVYVSQLMQADAIRTAIEAHRSAAPYNMGTLFWQWNDCWPVVSWSAVDYYGRKKALFYQVKRSFADKIVLTERKGDSVHVKYLSPDNGRVSIIIKYFDRNGKATGSSGMMGNKNGPDMEAAFFTDTLRNAIVWVSIVQNGAEVSGTLYIRPPKEINFPSPEIHWKLNGNILELTAAHFASGVELSLPDGVEPDDNYFDLLPSVTKYIRLNGNLDPATMNKNITIRSLADTY